jgi:hypothetical protein
LSVRVPHGTRCRELILAGCGRFDAGECVGSGGGGTLDPGDTEVGGGVDGAAGAINY